MLASDSGNPSFRSRSLAGQVETVREQFESAWKSGNRAQVEDFLCEVTDPDRTSVLRDLLLIEWQYRQLAGEEPTVEEYRLRFPEHEALIREVAANSGTIVRPASEQNSVDVSRGNTLTMDFQRPATGTPQAGPYPTLPGYEILGVLGRGGMGVVYQARDLRLKRLVAIKMIRAGTSAESEELARFRIEAEAVARLQHPNIVQIHAIGEHDGLPFFVLEFLNGGSLKEHANGTPLAPLDAGRIVEILARAMQAAHNLGIIHRDLKPANVLLTADCVPKISDFGLAKRMETDSGQTQTGVAIGTPSYMSPEQAAGRTSELGPPTDIYALGAVLYELLTGRPPFKAATPVQTLRQVLDQEPVAPRQLNPAVELDVETICLKSLAKSPGRRYATARDLAEDLRRWLHGEPITARPVGRTERLIRWCRRNPVVSSLIATAAILLIAVAVVSTVSAIQLKDLADRERNETIRANNETKRANDETETAQQERTKAMELARANLTLADKEKEARVKADFSADDALRQTKLAKRHLYIAHMNLAQSAWEDGRVGAVLDLLDRWRPQVPSETSGSSGKPQAAVAGADDEDLRGFEWYYWDRLCHSTQLELKPHTGPVNEVAYSSDGKRLASISSAGTVRVWDATNGREIFTSNLQGHVGENVNFAISADLARLASASHLENTVKVWDASSGQVTVTLKGNIDGVFSLAFNLDGSRLASAGYDKTVILWDASSGQLIRTFKGHAATIRSVAFSKDGNRLASADDEGTVKVWDTASGQELLTLKRHTLAIISLAFSDDGKRLASASQGQVQQVTLWDTTTGQETRTLDGFTNGIGSVTLSPDGKLLAIANGDRVMVSDVENGQDVLTLKGHTDIVWGLAFSLDGTRLASASRDQTVKVWDAVGGQETLTLKGHSRTVQQVVFGMNGKQLASTGIDMASAGIDNTVKLWDTTSGLETLTLKSGFGIGWESVAFYAQENPKALAISNRALTLWDVTSAREALVISTPSKWVTSGALSADGKQLAIATVPQFNMTIPGEVQLCDAISGQVRFTLKGHSGGIDGLAFSSDGKRVASASYDRTVKVWDTTSGHEVHTLKGHSDHITCVKLSADGKQLATTSLDQTVKIWDTKTGEETFTLRGHVDQVNSAAFSPDGKRLATTSIDRTVKVWDTATGQETLTLKEHTREVTNVAFAADGKRLASASEDGSIKIWDARTWTLELKAEQQAVSLLRHLFGKGLSKDVVLKAIADDETIGELVRQQATEMAGPFADNLARSRSPSVEQPSKIPQTTATVDDVNISAAFQLKNLRLIDAAPTVGDILRFSYSVENVSGKTVLVPMGQRFIGQRCQWIERLGDDPNIPVKPKNLFREGRRYAASGFSISELGSMIVAGKKSTFVHRHDTKGFPPGQYRFYVEFADNAGKVLHTEQVEFELKPTESK